MLDAAHGVGIRPIRVAKRVHCACNEVYGARVDVAGGVRRRAPVLAVRAGAAQGSRLTVAVARSRRCVAIAQRNAAERETIQNSQLYD